MRTDERPDSADKLLHEVSELGWNERRALQFERQYGDDVRRLVVLQMWRAGLVAYRFDPSRARSILHDKALEVFEDSLSDLWVELAGQLVRSYLAEFERSGGRLPFLQYLAGVLRNVVLDNARALRLLPRKSAAGALKAFCSARKSTTRENTMASVKLQLSPMVEREILLSCCGNKFSDVYRQLHRVVDFFFEQFVPGQCELLRRLPSRSVVSDLVARFLREDLSQALDYVGRTTPWDPELFVRTISLDAVSEDEGDAFASLLGLEDGGEAC